MNKQDIVTTEEIVEAEVLDENGRPVFEAQAPKDSARPKGDTGGVFGGILVLSFGFIMTLFVAAFSIFILLPLMLIGRVLGMEIKRFNR